MIVTTCYRPTAKQEKRCITAQNYFAATFVPRQIRSIASIISKYGQDVLVVSNDAYILYTKSSEQPLLFHPGSAMFRMKRLKKGAYDPFLEATQLKRGMRFLDCTLGMGTDALLAAYCVGSNGKVSGIEKSRILSFIVADGFQNYLYDLDPSFETSMRRIQVFSGDHYEKLKEMPTNAYDVVYFDPMFENPIVSSKGIEALREKACYDILTDKAVKEAMRVASQRVVLKAHYQSALFSTLGFHVIKRKTAQFHFGWIENNS